MLVIPAAFTELTGKEPWQVLLQARAIGNTRYVLATAQTGFHNACRQSHGYVMIVEPWGMVLATPAQITAKAAGCDRWPTLDTSHTPYLWAPDLWADPLLSAVAVPHHPRSG